MLTGQMFWGEGGRKRNLDMSLKTKTTVYKGAKIEIIVTKKFTYSHSEVSGQVRILLEIYR